MSKKLPTITGNALVPYAANKSTIEFPRNSLCITDTRYENKPPDYYRNMGLGMFQEFKAEASIGTKGNRFCTLLTFCPWQDSTGGGVKQLALADTYVAYRYGNGSEWFAWHYIIEF